MNTGTLVIYRNKPAVVTVIASEKIELRLPNGENKNVRFKDVEILHTGPVSILPNETLESPNWEEILELMDCDILSFVEFTELAYNTNTPQAAWSAWCELQRDIYFSGSISTGVKGRSRDEIMEKLAKINAKNEEQKERLALLERIRTRTIQDSDKRFMREIEEVALGNTSSSKLLKDLEIEATPEKAQQLLLKLGVWDYSHNPWPSRLGVDLSVPQQDVMQMPDEPRRDLTYMSSLAIDDVGSNDPDDAISWSDGLLWVHIADPGAIVSSGGELDIEAVARGSASYLPEGVTPMLPEKIISCCGLGLHATSPAISFGIEIFADGCVELRDMTLSKIKCERLTYESCAARQDISPLPEIREALERFRLKRATEGALFIKLPEVKIRLNDAGKPEITPCPVTPERELVANAMLACGHAVAKHCAELGITFPFVVQEQPEGEVVCGSLPEMYNLRRRCPAGISTLIPGRHYGLGVVPYSRVTSPLRRYTDLLAHQQLRRLILGQELLDFETIETHLTTAERVAGERRKLEKFSNEYWLLVYLQQHPDWEGEGVLVDKNGDRQTWLIPELAYEYKCRYQGKAILGNVAKLRLISAEPELMHARFLIQ